MFVLVFRGSRLRYIDVNSMENHNRAQVMYRFTIELKRGSSKNILLLFQFLKYIYWIILENIVASFPPFCLSCANISVSCGYAHLHIMFFITTKFHKILLSSFRGVALTNCFGSIFYFGQISKFKKGVIPRRIKLNKNVDNHIYTLCPSLLPSFTKICVHFLIIK